MVYRPPDPAEQRRDTAKGVAGVHGMVLAVALIWFLSAKWYAARRGVAQLVTYGWRRTTGPRYARNFKTVSRSRLDEPVLKEQESH
jgi:hypothetical protein